MKEKDYSPKNKPSKRYQKYLGGELNFYKFEPSGLCHGHKSRKDLRQSLNGIVRAKEKQEIMKEIYAALHNE